MIVRDRLACVATVVSGLRSNCCVQFNSRGRWTDFDPHVHSATELSRNLHMDNDSARSIPIAEMSAHPRVDTNVTGPSRHDSALAVGHWCFAHSHLLHLRPISLPRTLLVAYRGREERRSDGRNERASLPRVASREPHLHRSRRRRGTCRSREVQPEKRPFCCLELQEN